MKNRSFALIIAIVMIAALLMPVCLANDIPAADMDIEENVLLIAPDEKGEGDVAESPIPTVGATDAEVAEDLNTEKEDAPKMIFEPMNFVKNLYYMGLGMLGIFVVIGVIILATAALNKFFKEKKDE